jgi:hypothetical protein
MNQQDREKFIGSLLGRKKWCDDCNEELSAYSIIVNKKGRMVVVCGDCYLKTYEKDSD